ncbi:hypothetical protein MKW94_021541 [Papaver nudicaule]|uniref:Polygalacturonase n=1 Tax=Papaver nudicaule TaxID=74823 RepID=A0AA41VMK0_PAPNU|nr:hypothetical protein [Papaver nudicaule]
MKLLTTQMIYLKRKATFILIGILSLYLRGVDCREKIEVPHSFEYYGISCRKHTAFLTDFGGVGDGKTSNTKAFQSAIGHLNQFQSDGGSQLIVPPGRWLTGSFNLTSHFTLYLQKDVVLLASQEVSEWEVIQPLPSYGRGRDVVGGRYISLIFGTNLTDVIITGDNGTIDGQGASWWGKYLNNTLTYTRPYLIEIMFSNQIQISNITLLNSPSWNVHPIYSKNIIIQGLTILAEVVPISPNTDGINPDSCTNVLIEDCYIVSGDDCIAVKSGWDQYGISFGMPTQHLIIRRLTCISPDSAVIALGSELSGGIQDVRVEDILAINSQSGIRIKTAVGRGGDYGSHADDNYDKNAFSVINNINYSDMIADNVTMAGRLEGINGHPFTGICISNVTISMPADTKKISWNCSSIEGSINGVNPTACNMLHEHNTNCPFPTDVLPIETIELRKCFFR